MARPRKEIPVTLSDDFYALFRTLAHEQNLGRSFTLNQIAYEHVPLSSFAAMPPDARGGIKIGFLDSAEELNPKMWGIVNIYERLGMALAAAHTEKVLVSLDLTSPAREYTQLLPYKNVKPNLRFLQTALPFADSAPLSLFRWEAATVEEEATAVQIFLSSVQASLTAAYAEQYWPVIDPQEQSQQRNSMTFEDIRQGLVRADQRRELFGSGSEETRRSKRPR